MGKIENGGPAFPRPASVESGVSIEVGGHIGTGDASWAAQEGMSLRDYFAAKAMQSLVDGNIVSRITLAAEAYKIADEMLTARHARPNRPKEA